MILAIFILYGIIMQRLLSYAFKVRRQENRVILFGTASYLFVHFLLNVGGATALIPLTGVPLLMLSAGGTSLLSWYIMVGLCQGIIRKYNRGEE
jgi:cell division protein FtsW (lipid II flippase)